MEIDHIGATGSYNNNYNKKGSFKGNCYKCGTPGHIAKNCRVKKKSNLSNVENFQEPTSSSFNTPPVNHNSLELTHIEENKEQLLRFNGKVNGHSAWILLDSGASRNFIDKKFIDKHKLPTRNISPFTVELADGQKLEINRTFKAKKLTLGNSYYINNISVQVLPLQRYNIILGKPWFYHANPSID